jgi:hypothetical protein
MYCSTHDRNTRAQAKGMCVAEAVLKACCGDSGSYAEDPVELMQRILAEEPQPKAAACASVAEAAGAHAEEPQPKAAACTTEN